MVDAHATATTNKWMSNKYQSTKTAAKQAIFSYLRTIMDVKLADEDVKILSDEMVVMY